MKRWAICRMVWNAEGDPGWEPAIAKYRANWRIVHKGSPSWVLCQFSTDDITQIGSDTDIKVFPDATLDMQFGSFGPVVRNALLTRLADAGFETSGIKQTTTIREILNLLGRQIDPTFNCEAGDVPELE